MCSWDKVFQPNDHATVEKAHQKRALQVRAEYLIEMREKAGLTQMGVTEIMGVSWVPSNVPLLSRRVPSQVSRCSCR